ncbi:MAG TPA: arsenate reductase (glutaredoxin) [Pseudomonadales bacterium]
MSQPNPEGVFYHNPRCSKSRQALELLKEQNLDPEIILYLETPPSAKTLKQIITQLGISPRELLRTHEQEYKDLNLQDKSLNDNEIIKAMIENPRLIERPIYLNNGKAAIGRPPEKVLEIL